MKRQLRRVGAWLLTLCMLTQILQSSLPVYAEAAVNATETNTTVEAGQSAVQEESAPAAPEETGQAEDPGSDSQDGQDQGSADDSQTAQQAGNPPAAGDDLTSGGNSTDPVGDSGSAVPTEPVNWGGVIRSPQRRTLNRHRPRRRIRRRLWTRTPLI